MRLRHIVLLAPPIALALAARAPSYGSGYYTNTITRTTPSCGGCHTATPGGATVRVSTSARSLALGATASVTVAVSGPSGTTGGLAVDVTTGALTAGPNTALMGAGLTHANNTARSWTFGLVAPMAPGPLDLYAVALASDGSGSGGDSWAFHGNDPAATQATPVRLFVNAAGVRAIGESCVGSYGNVPVLGASQTPSINNSSFAIEMRGAAPASPAGLIVGVSQLATPIDLGTFGITGCQVFIDPCPSPCQPRMTSTGAGNAQRSEGSATFPIPIPNNQRLAGLTVFCQAFFADAAFGSGRATKFTFTNALAITVR